MNISAVRRGVISTLSTAIFLTLATACSTDAAPSAQMPPEVQVARPQLSSVTESRRYPAVLEAIDRAALHAQVRGYLESIEFEEGAYVKKGDVLFRIDARPYRARLEDAEAALAIAKAEANLADGEAKRAARLLERDAVSREDAERRKAQADVASARMKAAEAALASARLDVGFATVRAPFDGRMGRAMITVGNLVSPTDELAVLVALDQLHVRLDMDESMFGAETQNFSKGWFVSFRVHGKEQAWTGPVSIIGNEIRSGTGSIRLHATIDNAHHALLPGMFGEAELVTGLRENALLIDERAVGTQQGQRFVLVVNPEGIVEFRPVKLGAMHGDLREVLEGIRENDLIVTNGLMRVRPGAQVTPTEVKMLAVAAELLPSRVASAD